MNKKLSAYIKVTGVALLWGTIGVFRKNIPISSATLSCIRGLLGALVLSLPLLFSRDRKEERFSGKIVFIYALAGIMIGFNWILLFESYRYTSVATATLSYYMQPTILILVSPFIFGEKLTVKKILCAAAALCGMVLISGVADGAGTGSDDIKGILLGLGAAILYAGGIILNKKYPVADAIKKSRIILFYAGAILLPYILIKEDNSISGLTPLALILVLIVGIVHTGIAYALFYGSIVELPAQSVAVISYFDPVFALILSFAFLHEKMTVYGIIGAVLIIGSALVSELNQN